MGEGYYLVQFDLSKSQALRYVSAHALGGGYKLGEFWTDERIHAMNTWLTSVYGNGWSLVGEYSYDVPNSLENVGYTQQVRTVAVAQQWTNWTAIRNHDFVTRMSLGATDLNGNPTRDESDIPNGFKARYVHLFTCDELETYKEQVAAYIGFLWKKEWAGKTLDELVALGNATLKKY